MIFRRFVRRYITDKIYLIDKTTIDDVTFNSNDMKSLFFALAIA